MNARLFGPKSMLPVPLRQTGLQAFYDAVLWQPVQFADARARAYMTSDKQLSAAAILLIRRVITKDCEDVSCMCGHSSREQVQQNRGIHSSKFVVYLPSS